MGLYNFVFVLEPLGHHPRFKTYTKSFPCHIQPLVVDTQEPFNDSHHKIAFDYDEDSMSLVEELTLATLKVSLSNNSNSSIGNASTAFEYKCYKIEADAPQFNYHGPMIKIPKQELRVTVCIADIIGTMISPSLF
jgi:hypothetical protein